MVGININKLPETIPNVKDDDERWNWMYNNFDVAKEISGAEESYIGVGYDIEDDCIVWNWKELREKFREAQEHFMLKGIRINTADLSLVSGEKRT